MSSSQRGKDQDRIFMSFPVFTKKLEGILWERDVSIFCPFPPMDMDHQPITINIGDLKVKRFTESQPTGIDCAEKDVIVKSFDVIENSKDLFLTQDAGQSSFSFGIEISEEVPVLVKDIDKEEFDA